MSNERKKELNFLRRILNQKFQTLIFFVTSVCNSRCIGCFNWKNLNKKNNLTIGEIEKISRKMPPFNHVLFSGGEPTLRKDLPEICQIFRKNNHIESISIPTNGLLPEKISNLVEKIVMKNPKLNIGIHLSLDGMEKTHDFLRGVKGNFKKVQQTIKKINKLKIKYPQIDTSVNTVISDKNYKEIPELVELVKGLNVDDHTFDLLRGSIKEDKMIGLPSIEEIEKINKLRIKIKKDYTKKWGFFHRMYSIIKEHYLIKSQMKVLRNNKLDFPCLGGRVGGVIDHDGKVRLCELLPAIGDLRKKDYNFKEIWDGKESEIQRKNLIDSHECDCTHTCFLSMTIDHTPRTIFLKMPLNFLFKR